MLVKMNLFFALTITFLIHLAQVKSQIKQMNSSHGFPPAKLKCSNNETYCRCGHRWETNYVSCSSPWFNRDPDDVLKQMERKLNKMKEITPDDGTDELITNNIHFGFNDDQITKFDLIILHGFLIKSFLISHVKNLKKIVGGLDQKNVFVNVEEVAIFYNPRLDDDGLGETLRAFSASQLFTWIDLSHNSLTGNAEGLEFLPGFSSLVFLEYVNLSENKIARISTWHFQHLSRLKKINLARNHIASVKGSVFFVSNNLNDLAIDLQYNLITEILPVKNNVTKNPIQPGDRKFVRLDLEGNKLSSLPYDVFYDFLQNNENSSVYLRENPLVCDKGVEWLLENENESSRFSTQIKEAKCLNLQGAPLFKRADSDDEVFCPASTQIAPCTCQLLPRQNITCEGKRIVQKNIDNVIKVLRQENGIQQNQLLNISGFMIGETEMKELDLTQFFQVRLESLWISSNGFLRKIKSAHMTPGTINVDKLSIRYNPKLDDEGLGDILKLFSPNMKTLQLPGNSLRGYFKQESTKNQPAARIATMEREFFPGLGQLYNISRLDLAGNKIEHLGVGRFRNNSKVTDFELEENKISMLQKGAFFLYREDVADGERPLVVINLRSNPLLVNSFPLNVFGSTPVVLGVEQMEYSRFFVYSVESQKRWNEISLGLADDTKNSTSMSSLVCPPQKEIYPCLCHGNEGQVTCQGQQVNQKSVQTLFQKLKNANSANFKSKLVIEFKIIDSSIITLDLGPLIDCQISTFFVYGNLNLSEITGTNLKAPSLISVKELIFEENPKLGDSGIENLLTNFDPEIEILNLASDSLILNKPLKGLSTLGKLKVLNFRANKIVQLPGNFLNGVINRQLEHLDLSENLIKKVDQNAFSFSVDDNFYQNSSPIVINLNFNRVTENSFPPYLAGLENIEREIQLNLVNNKMTTLPFAPFKDLLIRKNFNLHVDLYGNPLHCDWRLYWWVNGSILKNSSVKNAECANQPRKFIGNFRRSEFRHICEEMDNFNPCFCKRSSNSLECLGDQVEEEGLQNLLLKIQRLNPFCSKLFPHFDQIVIRSTKLTQLDLTNFFDVCPFNLTSLVVDSNLNLTQILGPQPKFPNLQAKSSNMPIFIVKNLQITSNPLSDRGLGSALTYFSPQMATLNLNGNQLRGNSSIEFLPGLSNLKNLERIELSSNEISRLPDTLLKNNVKLRHISLAGNKISTVGPHALVILGNKDDKDPVRVDLSFNFLTDNSFDQKTFEDKMSRPLILILKRNRFSTIPATPFQSFLEANPANQLDLEGNLLICDRKLDWIKNRREEFNRTRIINAECDGDSIFNSKFFNAVDDGVLTMVLSIVIPAILILVLTALFIWRKFKKVQDRLLYLSVKDAEEFRKGNSNLDPKGLHAAVLSRPFDKSREISRELLEFDESKILGLGQYGIVFKGIFKSTAGIISVAVKTVKTSADLETFKSLLSEIKILDYLGSHQNIVQLLGASTTNIRKGHVLAVLEFCQNGDLRSFILGRKNNFQNAFSKPMKDGGVDGPQVNLQSPYENTLTTVQLLKFAMGIANGLKFLRNKNVIHGDLAARNILLTDKLETKISDFGLSRQLLNYQNYLKSTKCALPFKWMSIEAIKNMNFSICSDIWSFGVVLYEIFSLGESPYPGLAVDQEFLPRLVRGYRMEKPEYADQKIYELMLDTWKLAPLDRPPSDEIHCRLHQILDQLKNSTELTACVYVEC